MSPFCGATDTPYFGLLVTSPLVSKVRVGSALFELSGGIRVMLHVYQGHPYTILKCLNVVQISLFYNIFL